MVTFIQQDFVKRQVNVIVILINIIHNVIFW